MMGAFELARGGMWPWLLLGPLCALLLLALRSGRRTRQRRTLGIRADALTSDVRTGARVSEIVLVACGLFFAAQALLDPRWGIAHGEASWQGVDVVIALDVSRSMRARDLAPDRLTFAKQALDPLVARAGGDRFGLVLFAGEARLASPLTLDHASFVELARRADPSSVPTGGTDIGQALDAALRALQGAPAGTPRAIVLMTDGEDFGGRGERIARRCRAQGIPVHCVGLGSARGRKIPLQADGEPGFVRDRSGNEVVSAMDPRSLAAVADAGGGAFVIAESTEVLADLYEAQVLPQAKLTMASTPSGTSEPRYQWPLLIAILLWLTALWLRTRRRR